MWELADVTGAGSPIALLAGVALGCAALSLACALVGAWARAPRSADGTNPPREGRGIRFAWSAALLLAVPPIILVMVAFVGRAIRIAIVLLAAGPTYPRSVAIDGVLLSNGAGLVITVLLAASVFVARRCRRDVGLAAAQLWSWALVATWMWSTAPVFERLSSGTMVRAPTTVWLMVALSALVLAVRLAHWVDSRTDRDAASLARDLPVRSLSVLVFGTSILLCYHLAVPIRVGPGGFRVGMMLVAASGMTSAVSAFALCRVRWHSYLAESAMVSGSLGLGAACAIVIPDGAGTAAGRLPALFVAVVVGLASGSLIWTSVARHWRRGDSLPGVSPGLEDRLRPLVIRSAFYCAAVAALVSAIMAVWPRFPGVATTDETLGRFASGIAANMWLLLVLIVGARHERRLTFHLLALLTLISTGAFVALRLWPYAHKVSHAALP